MTSKANLSVHEFTTRPTLVPAVPGPAAREGRRSRSEVAAFRDSGVLERTYGGARTVLSPWRVLDRLSDRALASVIGALLLTSSAWLLCLTEVPPLQDLPNHLATITVIEHPENYPQFVFNGFFKTNAALFTWLLLVGKVVGVTAAARLFTLLVLAANAFALPRFVLAMTGSRRKLVVASFFMWPMVHNWFVSKGMLDFALGVPLALVALSLSQEQRRAVVPSRGRSVAIALVSLACWYAHVFALMVALMLVVLDVAIQPKARRFPDARRLLPPLVPGALLVVMSFLSHVTEPGGAMQGYMDLTRRVPSWELLYNCWAEYLWGFTKLSITSLVPGIALVGLAIYGWRTAVPFFSRAALVLLIALYVALPYTATNWFHVNSRVIPFLWAALLVRVPDRLPTWARGTMVVMALAYFAGMGVDYVRLEGDRQKFVAGIPAVPMHAHLLPLLFRRQLTSENTRSLLHAWGFYVLEKQTDAPLLFAHSRSFPVMYREPPPVRFNHLVLEGFAPSMISPEWLCSSLRAGGLVVDCAQAWRDAWGAFWAEALPRYDHLLLWDPPPQVMEFIPSEYRVTFQKDRLYILERRDNGAYAERGGGKSGRRDQ